MTLLGARGPDGRGPRGVRPATEPAPVRHGRPALRRVYAPVDIEPALARVRAQLGNSGHAREARNPPRPAPHVRHDCDQQWRELEDHERNPRALERRHDAQRLLRRARELQEKRHGETGRPDDVIEKSSDPHGPIRRMAGRVHQGRHDEYRRS